MSLSIITLFSTIFLLKALDMRTSHTPWST